MPAWNIANILGNLLPGGKIQAVAGAPVNLK